MNVLVTRRFFRSAMPRVIMCRAIADSAVSDGVRTKALLGVYFSARLELEKRDTLILTGFDEDGRRVCETAVRGKPLTDPKAAEKRLGEFVERTGCPFYAAGRKLGSLSDKALAVATDECGSVFRTVYAHGAELSEYAAVDGFRFRLLSGKPKSLFP